MTFKNSESLAKLEKTAKRRIAGYEAALSHIDEVDLSPNGTDFPGVRELRDAVVQGLEEQFPELSIEDRALFTSAYMLGQLVGEGPRLTHTD